MANYLLGDLQGCSEALERMLGHLSFSPSRDRLYVLGDLVNRGPDSAGVLRRLRALEGAALVLLGNHDLHALAVGMGLRPARAQDTLQALCHAPDGPDLLAWLRRQPLARQAHGVLMVHAGVLPSWTSDDTLRLAGEVALVLQSSEGPALLEQMYGNVPASWSEGLAGWPRLRVIVNALTRLRFCSAAGEMEFRTKKGADRAPAGFMPWFDVPGRRTAHQTVAFGHWSTLGWLGREDVLSLDTGCVWGGKISALALPDDSASRHRLIQLDCPVSCAPGLGD
jgi:bis(5'-nucleosyl)-tetraphosphatase (symmetrical)